MGAHLSVVQPNETANKEASNAQNEIVLEVRQADVSFGNVNVLKGVDFELRRGEFVCVIGPSGSGKTTLLRLLSGLIRPVAGQVLHNGKPQNKPAPDIAIVFQDYMNALLPWRDAAGNVSLALEAARTPKAERKDRIEHLLEKVGLGGQGHIFPSQMSGGMQQRLQIARCLAQDPAILLMDEPFGALDAMTRQRLQDELLRIVSESGVTGFFVTHDLEEAIYLGDRVIALEPNPGRIAEIIEVPLARPREQLETKETAEFIKLRRQLFDFIRRFES